MIETKEELRDFLQFEKELYCPSTDKVHNILAILKGELKIYRWPYIRNLRKAEYYYYRRKKNPCYFILYTWYLRKKNRLGLKLGMDIKEYVFDKGLLIHHASGIVVNGCAKVGKNCVLHGNNVIGNMGENTGTPTIGDNVRLGIGAKVLGDIYIADGVQIGAGALVIHSCYEEGALLVGVPAVIKNKNENDEVQK